MRRSIAELSQWYWITVAEFWGAGC